MMETPVEAFRKRVQIPVSVLEWSQHHKQPTGNSQRYEIAGMEDGDNRLRGRTPDEPQRNITVTGE